MIRIGEFRAAWLLVLLAVPLTIACEPSDVISTPSETTPSRTSTASDAGMGEESETIYVMSNGWHSAIVVPRALLPLASIPEVADFPDATYLSFGWGDAQYFPAQNPTAGMKLRAALRPTPAVIHVAGLRSHPRDTFPQDEVVELEITTRDLENLVAYLGATFDREGAERAQSTEPGLYRFSFFYRAKGDFHLFNTCNTWTARGLKAGGWPIRVSGTVRAEDLMTQIRPLAERQNSRLLGHSWSPIKVGAG